MTSGMYIILRSPYTLYSIYLKGDYRLLQVPYHIPNSDHLDVLAVCREYVSRSRWDYIPLFPTNPQ